MERTINCAECNASYTYNEKAGYPRKYCANCSQKKKASFTGQNIDPKIKELAELPYGADPPKDKPKTRTAEDITLGEDTKMAVNIYCTMVPSGNVDFNMKDLMRESIFLVKQAKEGLK